MQIFLVTLIDIYIFVLVIRALVSWFSPSPYNSLYLLLINITEPVLGPIRRFLFRLFPTGRIDFSPLVAILVLNLLRNLILGM
ncbi:MAG: YggT family protein [Candidatus Cloacimonetes bacterium]|nr:YggT family protein [Candidatus Cloacimonadota bacterium]